MSKNNERIVFIVEDNPLVLNLYVDSFRYKGYSVQTANNGEEAIEKLTSLTEKPDVILLDILLPKKNGYEVLEHLKRQENLRAIPVIFLTNIEEEDGRKKALTMGAAGYIIKSRQNPMKVIEEVEEVIKNYK